MLYPCPDASDIADVHALNRAFLRGLAAATTASPAEERLAGLDERCREALSRAPFLLFSLVDERRWDRAFAGAADLLDTPTPSASIELTTAAIAFLWHLSKRDPYSARLFSGASRGLCERLSSEALVRITRHALLAGVRPVPRLGLDSRDWTRLVDELTVEATREAAWAASIQRILLRDPDTAGLAVAACSVDARHRAVAERPPFKRPGR